MKKVIFVLILLFALSISSVFSAETKKYIEKKDIVYSKVGNIKLLMDMKTIDDGKKNKPAVISLHGGGWEAGSKLNGMEYANNVVEMGYTVFAINYRLLPFANYPAQIIDSKSAVRYIRANAKKFNIDPNRIASYGCSSGGTLATLLGVLPQGMFDEGDYLKTSSAVQAAINYSGWAGYRDNYPANPTIYDFYADSFFFATEKAAPHLLLYGATDDLVSYKNGALMEKILKQNNVYCEYYVDENGWHILSAEFIDPKIEAFLKKVL